MGHISIRRQRNTPYVFSLASVLDATGSAQESPSEILDCSFPLFDSIWMILCQYSRAAAVRRRQLTREAIASSFKKLRGLPNVETARKCSVGGSCARDSGNEIYLMQCRHCVEPTASLQ